MTPRRSAAEPPRKHPKGSSAKDTDSRRSAVKNVAGFVPLTSLKQGAPEPAAALDHIRVIYFNTTERTIHADLAHAIELLKILPSEEAREKATVYMEGLAQMRREWARKDRA
jgi:hypothetical protein